MEKEKYRPFFSTPFVASLTIGFIFFALLALIINLPKRQIIEKKAAVAQSVRFYFVPSDQKIDSNEVKVSLFAQFTNGSSSEHIDYLKTAVMLPADGRLVMKSGDYATTTFVGNTINFDRIFHVDGPTVTNTDKKMIIELGSSQVNHGPLTTNTQNGGAGVKIAEFTLLRNPGVSWGANTAAGFKVDSAISLVVVAPNSEKIPISSDSFVDNGAVTYVPGYSGGGSTPTPSAQPSLTPVPTSTPFPTLTPQPSLTPLPTLTTAPTATKTPTPIPSSTPAPTSSSSIVLSSVVNDGQSLIVTYSMPSGIDCLDVLQVLTGATIYSEDAMCASGTHTVSIPLSQFTTAPTVGTIIKVCAGNNHSLCSGSVAVSSISCPRKAQGDADCNGIIDGVDYSIWLNSQCHVEAGSPAFCNSEPDIRHDANFNGDSLNNRDDDDYYIWFSNRWT